MAQNSGVHVNITASDKSGAAFNSFNSNLNKTQKSVHESNAKIRGLRGGIQNLGFQIQDTAVQLQMGTNLMTVLGQQGSQVASSFGAQGAVVGALLAVAAALTGVFAPGLQGAIDKLFDFRSAMDAMRDSLDNLNSSVSISSKGIASYSDEVQRLANVSQSVARLQLDVELVRTNEAIKKSEEALTNSTLSNVMKRREALNASTQEGRRGMMGYRRALNKASEALDLERKEVVALSMALDNFQKSPTQGSLDALSRMLVELDSNSDAFVQLKSDVGEAGGEYLLLNEKAKVLQDTLSDLNNLVIDVNPTAKQGPTDFEKIQNYENWVKTVEQGDRRLAQSRRTLISQTASFFDQWASLHEEGSAQSKAFHLFSQSLLAANAIMSALSAATSTQASYSTMAMMTGNPGYNTAGTVHAALIKGMGFANAGMIMGQTITSFDGGGMTPNIPRSGGVDGKGGFPAILHGNEEIIDHTKGGKAGVINIYNYGSDNVTARYVSAKEVEVIIGGMAANQNSPLHKNLRRTSNLRPIGSS